MTSVIGRPSAPASEPTSKTLTVLTWNMAAAFNYAEKRHADAWQYLLTQLKPDIALLQEVHTDQVAAVIQQSGYRVEWGSHYPQGRWGSAVVTKDLPLERINVDNYPWLSRFEGAAVTCQVRIDDIELIACSIHARAKAITESQLSGIDTSGLSVPGFNDVWPLYVIFNDLAAMVTETNNNSNATRFIVGGDLNASRLLDRKYGAHGNDAFFDQTSDRGFVDLTTPRFDEEPQTFFREGNAPYQVDYLFSDQRTASTVDEVHIDRVAVAELGVSDHAPVIATLKRSNQLLWTRAEDPLS